MKSIVFATLLGLAACAEPSSSTTAPPKDATAVTTEKNREVVRRLYEDGINKGDAALVSQLIDDSYGGMGGSR